MPLSLKDFGSDDSSSHEMDNKLCGVLNKFHRFLSKKFYNLGFIIATSPSYFIMVPLFITLIFITGIQKMKYEKNPEYLFSPSNSQGRHERVIVEKLFPVNFSESFDPSRTTNIMPFARLIITAKDNGTMFRRRVWDDLMELNQAVENITVQWQSRTYEYKDICAIWNSKCIDNQVLDLDEIISEVEKGERYVNYPVMLFPTVLPFYYGGVKVNETDGVIDFVKSITLLYWLKSGDWMEEERALIWENKILELAQLKNFDVIDVTPFVSKSLENELERNTHFVLEYLPSAVMFVALFSVISIMQFDWVRSKIQITTLGITTAGLATGCSFGLLMYLGVPFIGMNLASPFILLGIGIDDMFVILSAWHRTPIQDSVPIRLANAYQEAAVSISITSLTNMLSFLVGAITPFPSVYIFCIYTGVSILMTYIFFITFFGACLALAGYQENMQKHALTFKQIKSKSESVNSSWCFKLCCTGGINRQDPLNRIDNQPNFMMTCFRDYFAKALNNPVVKGFIIVAFLFYLAGAIYGCFQVKEGLDKRNLALDDSYLTKYYDLEDSLFRKLPYRIQIIINEKITYSDPATKKQLVQLHNSFENLPYVGPRVFTQSWFRGFHRFLKNRPHIRNNITDEKSFIRILKQEYLSKETTDYLDLVFNEDETEILASRFIIQSYNIKDTNEDKDMMVAMREVAKEAPFEVITYFPLFVFFDQFVLVAPLTIQTICIVAVIMMVVSLIFIPNPFCCLWVIFSIISIEIGVVGYMSLWGVSLDCISMINLIMCIGFSVDFSAHISYSYLTAKANSPAERVRECMFNLGLPVMQSGLSTIAGVFVFIVAPSNIFKTFLKIITLVILFGIMHAILLLPVMLSLLGPGSCQSVRKRHSLEKTISNISKNSTDLEKASSLRINVNFSLTNQEKFARSSGSTCSEVLQYTPSDSDTESTRASPKSRGSLENGESTVTLSGSEETLEFKGCLNPAFEMDDEHEVEEEENHGSTYL